MTHDIENGDIWENRETKEKIYIYRNDDKDIDYILFRKNFIISKFISKDKLLNEYIYLYKSKCLSINDIFEKN